MQVCAPVPGSTCSLSTPRKRGEVGRRSAGYWNVNAGCGVYFSVTHIPFNRSTRKIVLKSLTIVCMVSLLRPFSDERGFALARSDEPLLAEHRSFLANLVLQPHQPIKQVLGPGRPARHEPLPPHTLANTPQTPLAPTSP